MATVDRAAATICVAQMEKLEHGRDMDFLEPQDESMVIIRTPLSENQLSLVYIVSEDTCLFNQSGCPKLVGALEYYSKGWSKGLVQLKLFHTPSTLLDLVDCDRLLAN